MSKLMSKPMRWLESPRFIDLSFTIVFSLLTGLILSAGLQIFPSLLVKQNIPIIDIFSATFFVILIAERVTEVIVDIYEGVELSVQKREICIIKMRIKNIKQQLSNLTLSPNSGEENAKNQTVMNISIHDLEKRYEEKSAQLMRESTRIKKLSKWLSLTIGLMISWSGVRILAQIFVLPDFDNPNDVDFFNFIDIFLTGVTIAGGSKAFHQIVSVFTQFLEEVKVGSS